MHTYLVLASSTLEESARAHASSSSSSRTESASATPPYTCPPVRHTLYFILYTLHFILYTLYFILYVNYLVSRLGVGNTPPLALRGEAARASRMQPLIVLLHAVAAREHVRDERLLLLLVAVGLLHIPVAVIL